jgi:hypothetical protein
VWKVAGFARIVMQNMLFSVICLFSIAKDDCRWASLGD